VAIDQHLNMANVSTILRFAAAFETYIKLTGLVSFVKSATSHVNREVSDRIYSHLNNAIKMYEYMRASGEETVVLNVEGATVILHQGDDYPKNTGVDENILKSGDPNGAWATKNLAYINIGNPEVWYSYVTPEKADAIGLEEFKQNFLHEVGHALQVLSSRSENWNNIRWDLVELNDPEKVPDNEVVARAKTMLKPLKNMGNIIRFPLYDQRFNHFKFVTLLGQISEVRKAAFYLHRVLHDNIPAEEEVEIQIKYLEAKQILDDPEQVKEIMQGNEMNRQDFFRALSDSLELDKIGMIGEADHRKFYKAIWSLVNEPKYNAYFV